MARASRPRRMVAAGLLAWLPGIADAVACMPPPAASWYLRLLAESPVIFSAVVTEVVGPQGDLARLAVTERWRGDAGESLLLGERGNPACRPRGFRPGERLVVFADHVLEPGPNRIGLFRIIEEPMGGTPLRARLDALRR